MQELTFDLFYSPIYSLAAPIYFTLSNQSNVDNSLGVVGGVNVQFDAVLADLNLNQVGIINIDNYNLGGTMNTTLDLVPYEQLAATIGSDFDLITANHNAINENLQGVIGDPTVLSCRAIAKIGVTEFQIWANSCCATTPEPRAKAAFCALAQRLNDQYVKNSIEAFTYAGCKYTVHVVKEGSKEVVELYVEWIRDVNNRIDDIMLWLSFVNTAEGMIWLTNEISRQ
ncbi:hypothetical protein [Sphingobacterium sp. GVS05A]|uniref:hypothetical protein n=1 Tax=Sphingobacterium sp. GVS05A TaxID=2862679 RepID=UPI001CC0DD25|nr:hypothetical protein [Sphingobacterium sp. GVS05A]